MPLTRLSLINWMISLSTGRPSKKGLMIVNPSLDRSSATISSNMRRALSADTSAQPYLAVFSSHRDLGVPITRFMRSRRFMMLGLYLAAFSQRCEMGGRAVNREFGGGRRILRAAIPERGIKNESILGAIRRHTSGAPARRG